MQNPKDALIPQNWYKVQNAIWMTQTQSMHSKKVVLIPKNAMIFFVNYSPSGVYNCKIFFGESLGWIQIPRNFTDHRNFFRKVDMETEE